MVPCGDELVAQTVPGEHLPPCLPEGREVGAVCVDQTAELRLRRHEKVREVVHGHALRHLGLDDQVVHPPGREGERLLRLG